MIARVWHGVVPADKAEGYARYLAESDLGVRAYQATRGNRGASLLRRVEGERVHFLLISLWESEAAIREYAGPDFQRAQYFRYDLECLIEPEPGVSHYEVLVGAGSAAAWCALLGESRHLGETRPGGRPFRWCAVDPQAGEVRAAFVPASATSRESGGIGMRRSEE